MDKFEEAICGHNPLYKEGLQDKYYQGAKWAWQSRQAEADQQKLLTRDSELHLDAAKEEIERLKGVVDKALNLINNWWHPNVDQKLFVEALGRALRGEHE